MSYIGIGSSAAQILIWNGTTWVSGFTYEIVQDDGVALPRRPILNFVGTGVLVTDDGANNRTNVSFPPDAAGVQTFAAATINTTTVIYNAGGPVGDFFGSIVVPVGDVLINDMVCYCSQSGVGSVRMAVYDFTGNKLGETVAVANPAVGFIQLTMVAPITILGGTPYYMGVWSNINGARFGTQSTRYNGAGPTLNFEAVNIAGLVSLPASVAASLSNKISDAVWVGAGT